MFLQQISRFIYFFLIIFLSQLSGLQCNEYRMHLLVHITLIVIVRSCITFCLLTLWCVCVLNIRVVLLHFEVAFRINYISLITLCCYCIVAQKQVFFCVLRDMVLQFENVELFSLLYIKDAIMCCRDHLQLKKIFFCLYKILFLACVYIFNENKNKIKFLLNRSAAHREFKKTKYLLCIRLT